ncbi:hypothetical protein C8R44DRAFT_751355 [Mycena epipterygia]|nr:hypothetical protein C8R44DRAFT_751355 [Mycena epipterygia]
MTMIRGQEPEQGSPAKASALASALGFCSGASAAHLRCLPALTVDINAPDSADSNAFASNRGPRSAAPIAQVPPPPRSRASSMAGRSSASTPTNNEPTPPHSHSSPAGYYVDYDEDELGSEVTDNEDDCLDEDDDEGPCRAPRLVVHSHPTPLHRFFPSPYRRCSSTGPSTPPPPTYALAEAAQNAHAKNMRIVLLPVFKNVVRRLIVECALDAADADAAVEAGLSTSRKPLDPAMRAARMSLADVVQRLREGGVWFDGMGWRASRRNARAEDEEREREQEREREREREGRHRAEGSDDSSAGTPRTSDTSPVLSTSTLGTMPSPPPHGEREYEEKQRKDKQHAGALVEEREIKPTIPVSPVLNPPRLLRPIPYIPDTIAHLPPYSLDAIKAVWREACTPLYHCRCTVCECEMAAQQAAQGGNASKATTSPTTTTIFVPPAPTLAAQENKETPREKDSDGTPWVMHIPAEDETTAGAESVNKLVEDDGIYERSSNDGEKGNGLEELCWLQVVEDEGPGAWEREMELVDAMASGKLKTPYIAEVAFLMDGGLVMEPTITSGNACRCMPFAVGARRTWRLPCTASATLRFLTRGAGDFLFGKGVLFEIENQIQLRTTSGEG